MCRQCIATERSPDWAEMTVANPDRTRAIKAPTRNRLRISITTKKGRFAHEYATSREVAVSYPLPPTRMLNRSRLDGLALLKSFSIDRVVDAHPNRFAARGHRRPVEAPEGVQGAEALAERRLFILFQHDEWMVTPGAKLLDGVIEPAAFEPLVVQGETTRVIADAAGVELGDEHAVERQHRLDISTDVHVAPLNHPGGQGAAADRFASLPASDRETDGHRDG